MTFIVDCSAVESLQSIDQGSSFHRRKYRFESGVLHTFLCLNTQLIFERRVTFLLSQTVRGAAADPSQALIESSAQGRDFQTTNAKRGFEFCCWHFAPVVIVPYSPIAFNMNSKRE